MASPRLSVSPLAKGMNHTCRVSPQLPMPTAPCNIYGRSDEQPMRRQRHNSSSRSPTGILKGLKDLVIRPRSGSVNSASHLLLRRQSQQKAMVQFQVNGCTVDGVFDLRHEEEEEGDIYNDNFSFRRPRSNSSDFLILRKTSRPLSVDVIGLVDAHSDPYRQYMKAIEVYELAPVNGLNILIDKNLEVDKAFQALIENHVGAALVWCGDSNRVIALVTLTDFLNALKTLELEIEVEVPVVKEDLEVIDEEGEEEDNNNEMKEGEQTAVGEDSDKENEKGSEKEDKSVKEETEPVEMETVIVKKMKSVADILPGKPLVHVPTDFKIYDACKKFNTSHIHRLVVMEPGSGDVFFLLTLKRILEIIHKQNRSLHFAQWLRTSIKDSNVGTWGMQIVTTTVTDTVDDAISKMLENRVSGLPLVNELGEIINVLVKHDIAMAFSYVPIKEHDKLLASPIGDIVHGRKPFELLRPTDTVGKVLDTLISAAHVRSVFIIDDNGIPIGCVSLSDVIRHLTTDDDTAPFQRSTPQNSNQNLESSPAPLSQSE